MKIGMLTYSFGDSDGRVRRVAEALAERGDDVDLFCLNKGVYGKYDCINSVNIYRIKKRVLNEKRKTDYIFRLLSFFFLAFIFISKKSLIKKYDVIHVHNVPDFLVFTTIFSKLMGAKIVLDIHDIMPEFFMQKFNADRNNRLARILKWLEKISINYVDHVIIANDIWKNTLIDRSIPADKITVILNTPDERYFHRRHKSKNNSDKYTLIYPGSLKKHFGVDVAIRAIDIIRRIVPSVRLTIIGDGPSKKWLEELVTELQLDEHVEFFGYVPMDKISEYISNADIGLVPKRPGIFSDNAMSTKLIEFAQLGVPAVVSRTPIEKFYFSENMVKFFEPGNHQDFAEAVLELYNNSEKKQSLVKNADSFNKKHNWPKYKNIYYNLIDNL